MSSSTNLGGFSIFGTRVRSMRFHSATTCVAIFTPQWRGTGPKYLLNCYVTISLGYHLRPQPLPSSFECPLHKPRPATALKTRPSEIPLEDASGTVLPVGPLTGFALTRCKSRRRNTGDISLLGSRTTVSTSTHGESVNQLNERMTRIIEAIEMVLRRIPEDGQVDALFRRIAALDIHGVRRGNSHPGERSTPWSF
ncbi:hypothetical protein K438DRAFT_1787200 [Mycena galopus ATCC 62051]|nr:hypothetical protein K438DRAFT_1787200 [Mycena galopus ATCC 62051]